MSRSLVVHPAVHPYRVAALNRWRAVVEAAARGESISAQQERTLYEAEMDAHDAMIAALAAALPPASGGDAAHPVSGAWLYDAIWGTGAHINADPFILSRYRQVASGLRQVLPTTPPEASRGE